MSVRTSQTGATAVYIALLVALLILSSALILSRVLNVQLRLTQDVISAERAFYAANSGVEQALFELIQNETDEITLEGDVEYPEGNATYTVEAHAVVQGPDAVACISSLGDNAGNQRRINLGPATLCE